MALSSYGASAVSGAGEVLPGYGGTCGRAGELCIDKWDEVPGWLGGGGVVCQLSNFTNSPTKFVTLTT